jgi:membrane-associated phospholipid phosphatase
LNAATPPDAGRVREPVRNRVRQRWAQALSVAGHPAVLMPLAVPFAARAQGADAALLRTAVAACILVAVITMLFSLLQVRRGRWAHVDASRAGERQQLNLFLAVLLLGAAGALHLGGAAPAVVAGLGLSGAMVVVAWGLRSWLKTSLHVAFALLAAGLAWPTWTLAGAIGVLAIGVAWSRVVLGRHTRAEVAAGALLGIAAGAAMRILQS